MMTRNEIIAYLRAALSDGGGVVSGGWEAARAYRASLNQLLKALEANG